MTVLSDRPWFSSYAEGVAHEIPLPEGSLYDLVAATIAEYPRAVALEFFGRETTYAELGEQIERAAEGLRLLGVQKGDTVALVLPNCPQHIVAFYAVLRLGAIVVEHNPLYTPRELRHQFEDHGARVVIAWNNVVDTLQEMPADAAAETIISVDVTRAMPLKTRALLRLPIAKARESRAALTTAVRGTIVWEDLLKSERIDERIVRPDANDLALIQYTSGTTGNPKGAMLSHLNLSVNAAQARAWVPAVPKGTAVVYAVLPMFHAYGLTLCLTFAMSMGARLVLFPKFDPDLVLPVIKKRPATFLPAVPPIYERLTAAADAAGVSLKGIEIAISGAMPLSASVVEPWEERTGGTLVEGYGLSETSPILIANPVGPSRRAGTVGLPLPNTEIRVVDPENPTVDRAAGAEGELIVRGPQVFSGYWDKPEETAEVFVKATDDGGNWFRTGDIVTVDPGGFVTIVDRIKELIITGGFNVAPSEVEEALRQQHTIADAAVVGMPSEHSGEDVVAAVVLAPGASLDESAIRESLRRNLAAYKVPKRVVVVDELPRSLIGKVLRRQVREQLLEKD
ncbi:long-chain acyl-CoA synthetase [Salinibacterium amurskyense]|uniref:Long-chain acyl-CoA synthetase n=1 Tax=Salinibacterium amurskyense TaxID=205941 RepID=A0A2M9D356_9MICO|nr:long-chain-fatty-acid--CoA ligase [Salinibacterium amurskyense]PJJ78624.1 long-chain acyl-CoA synthetase [Salinibacterium amurskyense]RLQ80709.1 long-chain fatty acid--CoA ligase [Salinibacterium amurskyense]GHD82894.1 long-chain-fatty-acid--CoA ligase [Salinibacterium amurskyense]